MSVAEIITEIEQVGGKIWIEGDRLKFRDTPARMVPLIREHKTELLGLLSSEQPESTTDAFPPASVRPEPRKGPLRASVEGGITSAAPMEPPKEHDDRGRPILTPPQVRCAECNSVASVTGQAAGVRHCNITGNHFDVDHNRLIWGFQVRTCSRFVARESSVSEGSTYDH